MENPMLIIRRPNLEPEVLADYLEKIADDRKTPDCFHVFFPNGVTPEEIDETLNKYGLSCDDISNWEQITRQRRQGVGQ